MKKKLIIAALILLIIAAFFYFDLKSYLTFDALKENLNSLIEKKNQNPSGFAIGYLLIYIAVTALSLPGATILTLAGGAIFGFVQGLILASIASTLGATLAFLVSRALLHDWVQKKFSENLNTVQANFEKEGALYLLSLRLIPAFPFFLVNLLMGLTRMRTLVFLLVSQLGMLPGTAAYINAGTQLSKIESTSGILTPDLILSFILLGILPWIGKAIVSAIKARKIYLKFKKPNKFDYNLVVIGAGSAGLVTSYIAAVIKAKVALIEKHKMGGDCLNFGCVPSKAIIKSAKVNYLANHAAKYGIKSEATEVDFAKVMARIQEVIKKIEPHDSVERYTSLGVECISGDAEIISPFEVKVSGRTLTTKNIVIASGAAPVVPNIPGLKDSNYLTSDNVWNLKELPKNLVVLGGGPIGCELAQAFARLGSKVTLIEKSDRLLSKAEPEAGLEVLEQFKKENINVLLKHAAVRFTKNSVEADNNGLKKTFDFDYVLVALGRKARVDGFGLEKLGIEVSKSGTIGHDEFLATKYPNIYVCGDCAGPFQFTHTAAHQAWYAAVNSLFRPFKRFKADYRVIPAVTFTDPEVAQVGITEAEAINDHKEFEITKYGIDDLDRAICEGEDRGFVKVITQKGTDKILGVTIVSAHAGEMLTEFVLAMKYKLGLSKILGTIHSYPTFSEANKMTSGIWKKNHAPENLLKWVERFHTWKRN